jgi:flagellar assembly factor FliW
MDLSHFGAVERDRDMLLHVPAGLLGFADIKHYRIVESAPEIPLKWLQARDEPQLAFVIIDPFVLLPDYQVEVTALDRTEVGAEATDELFVVAIVTLPRVATDCPTVNLQGPILVNRANGWAKQLVLVQGPYHTQHPLTYEPSPLA